jgi:hypothetical protein
VIVFAIVVGALSWGGLIYFFATDPVMRDSLRRKR